MTQPLQTSGSTLSDAVMNPVCLKIRLSVKRSSRWRCFYYQMNQKALSWLISLCYLIHKIPSRLARSCKGAEASIQTLILVFFFFFFCGVPLCPQNIRPASVKFPIGSVCAWWPCAGKCVFVYCVNRDGEVPLSLCHRDRVLWPGSLETWQSQVTHLSSHPDPPKADLCHQKATH